MSTNQRPAETAAYEARVAAAAQVAADLKQDLHSREVLAAHEGAPSIAVQDRTHGAGLPAMDHGHP